MTISLQIALTFVVFFVAIRWLIQAFTDKKTISDNVAVLFGGLTVITMISILVAAVEFIWF